MYRSYDQAALDAQYNMRLRHPDFQHYFDRNEQESERVRRILPCRLNIPYGDKPGEKLDVFPAPQTNASIQLFIHGGYWQALDKSSHSFVAEPLVAAGCTAVVVNYTLAPEAHMDEIVQQNRRALAWTYHNASAFNGDSSQIYISGHSAGGHLVAMMMATDWTAERDLPFDLIKGGCAISGLFDLEPIRLCYLNEALGMDEEAARQNSPIYHLPTGGGPIIVAVGAIETEELFRHSAEYAAALKEKGYPHEYMVLPDLNHFGIIQELGKANSPLTQTMLKQMSKLPSIKS